MVVVVESEQDGLVYGEKRLEKLAPMPDWSKPGFKNINPFLKIPVHFLITPNSWKGNYKIQLSHSVIYQMK